MLCVTFELESADLHHSVTEIIKYFERLLPFACLVFSITLCETLFKFQPNSQELECCVTKVNFQVQWLQVGGGRKISEVSVRVCCNWQRLFSTADKGWAVIRARPSKNVWCSGLGLCLEMSLVFDFGQGLRCGLSIRHCRCHWIMAAWFVFLHFFLVPLCWYAVSERQMLLFFAGGLVRSRQTSPSKGFSYYFHHSTTELYFTSTTRQCRCYSKTKIN